MSFLLRVASVSLVFAAGCAVDEDAPSSSTTTQAAGSCPVWLCGGGNSPEIDHLGLHDLNLDSRPNANGFILDEKFKHPNGFTYVIEVDRAQVRATSIDGGPDINYFTPLGDAKGLDDLPLYIKHSSGGEYELRFIEKGRVPFFARPGGTVIYTTSYKIVWDIKKPVGGKREFKNVCKQIPSQDDETLGMNVHHAVVFENDRIDAEAITVSDPEKRWFNIGCATHALAKLHLSGHTEAAKNISATLDTKPSHRTAFLKMVTGDYCGNGNSLTTAGVPLKWRDEWTWMTYVNNIGTPIPVKLEARWSENGANCINEPRVLANPTAQSLSDWPDIWDSIKAACNGNVPPPCEGTEFEFDSHINSGNPL